MSVENSVVITIKVGETNHLPKAAVPKVGLEDLVSLYVEQIPYLPDKFPA